jgi:hypothetical protein
LKGSISLAHPAKLAQNTQTRTFLYTIAFILKIIRDFMDYKNPVHETRRAGA